MAQIGNKYFNNIAAAGETPIYQRTGGGTGGGVSKYTTGWISTPSAPQSHSYTHNLGTEDITYKVYVKDYSGIVHDITGGEVWDPGSNNIYANCNCVNLTSTQITIRLFDWWLDWKAVGGSSTSSPAQRSWVQATYFKVVVTG